MEKTLVQIMIEIFEIFKKEAWLNPNLIDASHDGRTSIAISCLWKSGKNACSARISATEFMTKPHREIVASMDIEGVSGSGCWLEDVINNPELLTKKIKEFIFELKAKSVLAKVGTMVEEI